MAIPFRDFFEFKFNNGRGIRTAQLDGEITQAQLADDTGIREYVGESFTHDSVNNRITGSVRGLDTGDTFERYSRMIAFSPDPLGRQSDALRMVAHNVNLPLVDRDGQPVSARQITPGRLYEILQAFSAFAFIQPLGLRPQDYKILSAISEDETFTEAEILAGTESPTDSNVLNTPIFDDFVSRVSIRERGSGYTSAPTVQFSGGGGIRSGGDGGSVAQRPKSDLSHFWLGLHISPDSAIFGRRWDRRGGDGDNRKWLRHRHSADRRWNRIHKHSDCHAHGRWRDRSNCKCDSRQRR